MIETTVPETQLVRVDVALSTQHGTSGMTVPEWLKTPSARHSPSTITETPAKIRFLKEPGAHAWVLDAVMDTPFRKNGVYPSGKFESRSTPGAGGAYTPIIDWLLYAGHGLAP